MKALLLTALLAIGLAPAAKADIPPSIHVEGKDLVDTHGNKVVMHGVMDTPSMYFNSGRWGWGSYDATDAPTRCLDYFEKVFAAITDTKQGANCTVFRLHLDPAWTNNGSVVAAGFTQKDGKWYDPNGTEVGGEADIKNFDMTRFKKYWTSVYWKLAEKALKHGLHVVMRPPGVCPGTIKVGDYYQQYLIDVWSYVASYSKMKQYSGQVTIELANEPVRITNADGTQTSNTMHDYFQPVVDAIRANGYTGIVWVPGGTWQQDYRGYAEYPIEGYNIGYAVHAYVGWYNCDDKNATGERFLKAFLDGVPVVKTNPVIVTEIDWSPEKEGTGHYNESGAWVVANYGTWATGTTGTGTGTGGWGGAFKYAKDKLGNVSMTLSGTDCLIDMQTYLDTKKVVPAFATAMKANGLDPYQGCGQACMNWYAEYAQENQPKPDFASLSTNLTNDQKKFLNPVIAADFPDPDVTRLGDTYYFLSTTMHLLPGATVLKSKDLVNWEYCCNPLEKLSDEDKHNLIDGKHSYAGGMWAGAIEAHNGKLYILLNCNDAGAFVLSTDNPDGKWEVKKLARGYYDPGMIFEGDKIYVACGIDHINICELDKDWNFIRESNVIKKDGAGLEGCHLYHIGDYYYIYATYGGWPTGQTIFRSSSVMGPYEEKSSWLLEKTINGTPNTVHQGALIEIPQSGEWWTMLMEDKGAIGRLPSLHPVTWSDGWPTICKNGVPQQTYTRPNVGSANPVTILPTNDNFRSYKLGQQWQWNHGAPTGLWSLLERPGYLRLRTSSVADDMMLARGTLTQRIFAFHKTSGGIDTTKPSTGTICLDVRGMEDGDMAGIAVQQDPYAMLAVTKDETGKYSLVWKTGSHTGTDNFTPATKTAALDGFDAEQGIIYLRARYNNSSSEATFFYSLDNKTWTQIGSAQQLRYNLSVFVGARWAVFNYATRDLGGYVDLDWFTTEDSYDEAMFYPADFEGYNPDMLTVTNLTLGSGSENVDVLVGGSADINLVATFADGHTENVAAQASYNVKAPEVLTVSAGRIKGLLEGQTDITVSYTDPMGNEFSTTIKATSSYFPFAAQYIRNVYGSGTYTEKTRVIKPSQYGQMGWEYSTPVDMSGYKYLIILLDKIQTCEADLRIYTQPSIWGSCYRRVISTSKKVIVKLQTLKYTDGDDKGKALDLANIHKVVFWSNGGAAGIDLSDMYLTNNDDYTREDFTPIEDVEAEATAPAAADAIYDIQGRRVTHPTRGLYIRDGKKVLIK